MCGFPGLTAPTRDPFILISTGGGFGSIWISTSGGVFDGIGGTVPWSPSGIVAPAGEEQELLSLLVVAALAGARYGAVAGPEAALVVAGLSVLTRLAIYDHQTNGPITRALGSLGTVLQQSGEENGDDPPADDADKPAEDVLPGSLKPEFPGEHLGKSLNEIKESLKTAKGKEKRSLQKAKKLLEQIDRLMGD